MVEKNKNLPFTQVIEALLDQTHPFPAYHLHRFSDLPEKELDILKKEWGKIHPDRRLTLLEDLEELAEADTLLCFDDIARYALDDEHPRIRETAIHLLWEVEDTRLATQFMKILLRDTDEKVRTAAAGALGLFVYLGELEQISSTIHHQVEESLLDQFTSNEPKAIRRKALESLGYSGREEVIQLISTAFATNENEWMASALCAMGRSADIRWEASILNMLEHPLAQVQEEAIRAAGELELSSARQPLLKLLEEKDSLDSGVFGALVWSLSQIGGEHVREALEELAEDTEDDVEIDYIESALENLEFTDNFTLSDMFDFDVGRKSDLDSEDDDS